MWWDDDSETYQTVLRLNGQFLEELKFARGPADGDTLVRADQNVASSVYGVGSVIGRSGRRVPMLMIDETFAPRWHRREEERSRRIWYRMQDLSRNYARKTLLIRFETLDEDVREMFRNWNVPGHTQVLFTTAPQVTAAEPGSRIWAKDGHATVGFMLPLDRSWPDDPTRFLVTTAGHLVPDVPAAIMMKRWRWFAPDAMDRVGIALHSSDPTAGTPGVDVAMIELTSPPRPVRPYRICSPALAHEASEFTQVVIRGGISKQQRGWLLGAMMSTRTIKQRIWRNCWTVVESRNGLVQPGDSGGAAILAGDGPVLGHVVAAMGTTHSNGRRQIGIVQDMQTIIDHLHDHYPGGLGYTRVALI